MTRGKDKIDFDQTCEESFFFDLGEVLAPSPRKLSSLQLSSLLFNYKEISTLMEICSIIQVNTD